MVSEWKKRGTRRREPPNNTKVTNEPKEYDESPDNEGEDRTDKMKVGEKRVKEQNSEVEHTPMEGKTTTQMYELIIKDAIIAAKNTEITLLRREAEEYKKR